MTTDESGKSPTDQIDDVVVPEQGKEDPLDTITDPEELRRAAKANRGIAARYKERAKAAPPADTSKKEEKRPDTANPPDIKSSPDVTRRLDRMELTQQGYSLEEADLILESGGLEKALKNPIIKAGLELTRAQRVAERAAVGDSSGGGDAMPAGLTEEKARTMSAKDLEKALPKGKPLY